jgi:P4 family phage/plasmid primase-like protien
MSRTYTEEEIANPYHKHAVQLHEEQDARAAAKAAASTPAALPAVQSKVTNLAAEREARTTKPQASPTASDSTEPYHIVLAKMVIGVTQERGGDLMFVGKTAYRYLGGLWFMDTEGITAWLNVEIERAAQHMKQPSNNKLVTEARGWILRQKKLNRSPAEVKWDSHGLVPTRSGLVDPITGDVRPMRPEDYCTWRIEAEYDPAAVCPWWLQMLDDCFADRSKEERDGTIAVIQELLGAGLINDKPRDLSKALIFQGGSNFGKSGLLDVLGGLFGGDVNSTPIEALEGAHGLMPFQNRKPWVLHEAFDQRKWHFSSAVKAIVTGDQIQVNVKNGPMLSIRVQAPIFWGTNHPPAFKESTKAITNRLTVIECKREFFEDKPVGAAKEAKRLGLNKPSTLVLRDEMPGLLAWSVDGLKRALERGRLLPTAAMRESTDEIRKDSNLVAGFLEDCCEYDYNRRISAPDFCLAFAAWWKANKSDSSGTPSGESIGKALQAMSDQNIAIDRKALRDTKRRYYAGIMLNEEGLAFHRAGHDLHELRGKTANATAPTDQVNQLMTEEWLKKPVIIAMRERQVEDPRKVGKVGPGGKVNALMQYIDTAEEA